MTEGGGLWYTVAVKDDIPGTERQSPMEYNDIYDKERNRTGRIHLRGTPWKKGEYGLVVCVWVADGKGNILLTRRAPEKTFAGTWENSGGAAQAGESSLQAITRELFEETGIRAEPEEFQLIGSGSDRNAHFDYYTLLREIPIEQVVLQPGETDDAKWVTFGEIHQMIRDKKICRVIARQFQLQEKQIPGWQNAQKQM